MAGRGYGPTIRLPGAPKPHPTKPIRPTTPTVLHSSCLWQPLETERFDLRISGPEVANSGRMIRLFDLVDPHFNKKTDANWVIDVEWLVSAGYSLFFVRKADVCMTVVPSDTSYTHGINRAVMFMCEGEDPIPSPETRWQFFQYTYPIMKSKTVKSAYSGSVPTTIRMSFIPSYNWPFRSAKEDPDNWGIFPIRGAPGTGSSPPANIFLWYGVASTQDTIAANATYYVNIQVRYHYTAIKDTINPVLPENVPSDAFVPASAWTTLEGLEPAADANEGAGAGGWKELSDCTGGVAADLSAHDATYLPQWYNNAP